MKLKCQSKGANCPPFKHNGIFHPDNKTVKRFLPDLNRCADCMACDSPSLLNFRDDFLQIASMTLVEKGTAFNPTHKSGAKFGTFIRPRICISLTNARNKELLHQGRERLGTTQPWDADAVTDAEGNEGIEITSHLPHPIVESFVDGLLWDVSVANFEQFLPQILKDLTPRERQVFALIREDTRNCDIAEALHLKPSRISYLVKQVKTKLKQGCLRLGLIE